MLAFELHPPYLPGILLLLLLAVHLVQPAPPVVLHDDNGLQPKVTSKEN